MSESEPKNRPSASGHRFGPDLACSECGITWEEHQQHPLPCHTDESKSLAVEGDERPVQRVSPDRVPES